MQKALLLFSLALLFICATSQSQDNIYPLPSGPVGIGTSAPSVKLHVVSTNHMFSLENPDGTTANQYTQMLLKAGTQNNYIWTNNQNSPDFYGGSGALNIYTGQASPIAFFTNATSTPRMVVASGGNIGVGITNPAGRLSFTNLNDSDDPLGITWYSAYGDPTRYGIHRTAGTWTGPDYQQLRLGWETGIVLDPGTAYGKSYVDIRGGGLMVTSGNVGIGTNSPTNLLEAAGTISSRHTETPIFELKATNYNQPFTYGGIVSTEMAGRILGNSGSGIAIQGFSNSVSVPATRLQGHLGTISPSQSAIVFEAYKLNNNQGRTGLSGNEKAYSFYSGGYDDGNAILTLLGNGNIGIGTEDTKGYRLAVNGTAIFIKVKVQPYNAWADYVFNKDYRLRSLKEVEKFIRQHHHLPEVPSVTEVEKNGLDLGDSQATLLKKIEELTLYLIDQNKKLEMQQRQINNLLEKVANIKKADSGK